MSDYNLEQPHALPHVPTETVYICPAQSELAASGGSVARGVITELNLLRDWIKDGSGYNRDDAPDEIARAIANRIREIEAREKAMPPNDQAHAPVNNPEQSK